MKKTLIIGGLLFTGMIAPTSISAQKLKDKLNKAKENAKAKMDGSSKDEAVSNGEFVNIADLAKQWETGEYELYGIDGFLVVGAGKKKVEFIKDGEGNVKEIKIGDESYLSDATKDNPIVVAYNKKGGRKLFFNEEGIVIYYYFKGTHEQLDIVGYVKAKGKPKNSVKEVKAYRETAKVKGEAEKEKYASIAMAQAEAEEAERRKKYGLEGKDVTKIEFENFKVPDIFGHWSGGGLSGQLNGRQISFDIKATLKDGSTISTAGKGTGYMTDYEISYDEKAFKYGQLETGWSEDDVLTLTVKCKTNPSLIIKKDIPIKYNQNISYNRNAAGYSGSHGYHAQSFKIEVKQVKHKETGTELIQYRITNTSTGEIVDEAKISTDYTLYFTCKGGPGGVDGNQPKNGGNGGHILLIKDPSVKDLDFEYSVDGGPGGTGPYNSGQNGRTGTFKEKVQAVKF